jgi:hypothetical protein
MPAPALGPFFSRRATVSVKRRFLPGRTAARMWGKKDFDESGKKEQADCSWEQLG